MKNLLKIVLILTTPLFATTGAAQDEAADDTEQLKLAAIEVLITAPPEKALPLVNKVLADDSNSDELKERALFILSQIDRPGAHATLLEFARNADGDLQAEAIRMIGIGGNREALNKLKSIYDDGDGETREAVLDALMIAGDRQTLFDIAVSAEGEDFEHAVDMLGAMGAREELRELRGRAGASEALIDAYAISSDFEALREISLDRSNPELQVQAIEAMGIVGGDEVDATLVQIYRDAETEDVRQAALDGMVISGNDAGLLELYRSTDDAATKREVLRYLVIMDSDEVWNIIDSALEGGH